MAAVMFPSQLASKIRLELKLTDESPCSSCRVSDVNEPNSPDSGFSSDEYTVAPPPRCKLDRSKTLPSALRRARSKQCQKRVRFADALGLDLEKREYFTIEENVCFPIYKPSTNPANSGNTPQGDRIVLSNFIYRPDSEYVKRARGSHICVSALRVAGESVIGQVDVLNIAFNKKVYVRFTSNNWTSHMDIPATYSHSSTDIDSFTFTVTLPTDMKGDHCEFCICYSVSDKEFWDNNTGRNYHIDIVRARKENSTPFTFKSPKLPIYNHSARFSPRRLVGRGLPGDDSDEEPQIYSCRRKGF